MSLFSNNIFSPKGDTGKMEDERDSVTPTPSLVEAPTESTSSPDNHKDPPIIMNTPSPHATGITRGFTDFGTPPMRPAEHNSDDGVPFASVGKKVVLNLRPTTGYTDATQDERRAHTLTDEELNARRSGANDPWTPDSEASPDEKTAPHEALMNRATKFSSKKAEKNKQKAESTHYNTRGPGGYSPVLDSLNRVWNKGQEHGFVPIAEYKQRLKKASPFSEECKTKGWDFKVTNEFGEEVRVRSVGSRLSRLFFHLTIRTLHFSLAGAYGICQIEIGKGVASKAVLARRAV